MTSADRRARERLEVRERILAAARDVVVREGFDAVTMRRVAQTIDYSPAALYSHFKDKDELLRDMCDEDWRLFSAAFHHTLAAPDPLVRLRQMGRAYVRFAVTHPQHYRLMFMTDLPPSESCETAASKGDPTQDSYALLVDVTRRCIQAGKFREGLGDADLLAQVFWGAGHGPVSLFIARNNDDWVPWRDAEATANLAMDAALRGLARRPDEVDVRAPGGSRA